MAIQVQRRRGTTAQNDAFTGALAEFTYDTDLNEIRGHDGARAGGWNIPNFSSQQLRKYSYGAAGGTADAITVTTTVAPIAMTVGLRVSVKIASANTTSATLAWGGLTAKTIKKFDNGSKTNLAAGDLVAGKFYDFDYDGTDWIVDLGGATGPKLITSLTASASSTLDFGSSVITGYDIYEFHFIDLLPSADNDILFRVSTDGGSTFSTASAYYSHGISQQNASAVAAYSSATTTEGYLNDATVDNSGTNGGGLSGKMIAAGLSRTTKHKQFSIDTQYTTGAGAAEVYKAGGHLTDTPLTTSAINGFRFLPATGNFTSGKIKLYGY